MIEKAHENVYFKRKAVYVYDPKALQNIVIKDQYIYELPEWNTTYVVHSNYDPIQKSY